MPAADLAAGISVNAREAVSHLAPPLAYPGYLVPSKYRSIARPIMPAIEPMIAVPE